MRPKHCLLMSCVVYTRLFTNQISDTTVRTTVLNLVWTPNDKLNWFARNTTDGEGHSTKSKYCISNAKRMMGCVKKILHLVSHRRIQLDQLTPLLLAGQMLLLTTILLSSCPTLPLQFCKMPTEQSLLGTGIVRIIALVLGCRRRRLVG